MSAATSYVAMNYWLKVPMAMLNCVCIAGYSLVAYVLASTVCVLPYLSWPAVLAAAACQTSFQLKAVLPAIEQHPKEKVIVYAGLTVAVNACLMFLIKLYLY